MKKTRKILAMMACAVLLVCISVGATVAYLTSTDTVTNTFTVGKVDITLDEANVNAAGKPVSAAGEEVELAEAPRVKSNEYHLYPGHSYTKDPTVHFAADSDNSYLFVKVENGIANIEAAYTYTNGESKSKKIADQILDYGWLELDGVDNVYYREVTSTDAGKDYQVFAGFMIDGTVENNALAAYETTKADDKYNEGTALITITAYAVQSDGFANAKAAWNATFGAPVAGE